MASGRNNKLVGQIGEFLVCAELGRRDLIATPFSGNVPGFDVIATDKRFRSVPIQVKTSAGSASWQFSGSKILRIRVDEARGRQRVLGATPVPDPATICVFVWLGHSKGRPDRFFILTRRELQRVFVMHYRSFLRRYKGRRPQNPRSTFVAIRLRELEPFEDNWKLIERRLGGGERKAN